jgi:hypothetical protein
MRLSAGQGVGDVDRTARVGEAETNVLKKHENMEKLFSIFSPVDTCYRVNGRL